MYGTLYDSCRWLLFVLANTNVQIHSQIRSSLSSSSTGITVTAVLIFEDLGINASPFSPYALYILLRRERRKKSVFKIERHDMNKTHVPAADFVIRG